MDSRFAGAADVGQRRRRRLASSESDDVEIPVSFAVPQVTVNGVAAGGMDEHLLRRAISPRLWKHLLLLASVFALGALLIYARVESTATPFERFLQNVNNGLCSVFLLLSAQFALAIGWLRSRSDVDYQGRYRWWKWIAVWFGISALLVLTDSIDMLPVFAVQMLQPVTGEIQAARHAVVLVPAIVVSTLVFAKILPDMKRCLGSQCLCILALMCLAVRLMLTYGASANAINSFVFESMALGTTYLMFASMLIHFWFVGYVSNDPPSARQFGASFSVAGDGLAQTASELDIESGLSLNAEDRDAKRSETPPVVAEVVEQQPEAPAAKTTSKSRSKRKSNRKSRRKSAA